MLFYKLKYQKKRLEYFRNGVYLAIFFIFYSINVCVAQQRIDLNAAIDSALKNNNTLKFENLKILLSEKQKETYKNIPKTNVSTEIGQINTNLIDSKFGISQNISLPIVYKKQKELLKSYYVLSQSEKELKAFDIKKNIHLIFNNLSFLNAKIKLLSEIDSLYDTYEKKANIRFNKGESNLLEKTLGEQQRQNVNIQQMAINQEILDNKFALKIILNLKTNFEPILPSSYGIINSTVDRYSITSHPLILNLKEIEKIEKAKSEFAKAQQKSELMFGLNNTSFSGPAANVTDKTYNNLNRFSAVQFGLSIPINAHYYKKINEANKISEKITEAQTIFQEQLLNQNLEKLQNQYFAKLKAKEYFEVVHMPNVIQIGNLAEKRFASGEINFIDLTNYLSKIYNSKSEYIDLLNTLNILNIEMRFLN